MSTFLILLFCLCSVALAAWTGLLLRKKRRG